MQTGLVLRTRKLGWAALMLLLATPPWAQQKGAKTEKEKAPAGELTEEEQAAGVQVFLKPTLAPPPELK